ncbi:hypothetical protein AB0M20_43510, partial [Actinoplanes sp. NPDC051633]
PARSRRRSSAAATFSDASSEAMVDSPLDSAESDGPDDGDKPRRRRRRGGRGNRGSGASSDSASSAGTGDGEMTGGSEAGVGTTA